MGSRTVCSGVRLWALIALIGCCVCSLARRPSRADIIDDSSHIVCGPAVFENTGEEPREYFIHCSGIAHARGLRSIAGPNCNDHEDCSWEEYGQRGDYELDWEEEVDPGWGVEVGGYLTADCDVDEACPEPEEEEEQVCVVQGCPYDGDDWYEHWYDLD